MGNAFVSLGRELVGKRDRMTGCPMSCCVPFLPRSVEPTKITKCLMVADFRGGVHGKLVFRQRCKSYVDVEMLKEKGNVAPWVGPKVTNCFMHGKPSGSNRTTHTFL